MPDEAWNFPWLNKSTTKSTYVDASNKMSHCLSHKKKEMLEIFLHSKSQKAFIIKKNIWNNNSEKKKLCILIMNIYRNWSFISQCKCMSDKEFHFFSSFKHSSAHSTQIFAPWFIYHMNDLFPMWFLYFHFTSSIICNRFRSIHLILFLISTMCMCVYGVLNHELKSILCCEIRFERFCWTKE